MKEYCLFEHRDSQMHVVSSDHIKDLIVQIDFDIIDKIRRKL
jgi:hypothetical protein